MSRLCLCLWLSRSCSGRALAGSVVRGIGCPTRATKKRPYWGPESDAPAAHTGTGLAQLSSIHPCAHPPCGLARHATRWATGKPLYLSLCPSSLVRGISPSYSPVYCSHDMYLQWVILRSACHLLKC